MTPTLFRRAAFGLMGLSLASVLGVQLASKSTSAAVEPPTPAAMTAPTPTAARYNCGDPDHPDYISFKWTRPMPQGGWLGEVSYGSIVSKPVQVFDAKPVGDKLTDWTYQAQDGSFLCHMTVSTKVRDQYVSFGTCKNRNWPEVTCSIP